MLSLNNTNPIGIGTYKLDLENKEKTLQALLYSVSKGQNLMSTSLLYDNGKVVDLLYPFFQEVNKDDIFLTCHLEKHLRRNQSLSRKRESSLSFC